MDLQRFLAEHQRDHRQAEDDAGQHQRPHRAEPQKQAAESGAPVNNPTEATRRRQLWLVPPAGAQSAKMPVKVTVITLVARSGTPCTRTMAFWMPIASASRATTT